MNGPTKTDSCCSSKDAAHSEHTAHHAHAAGAPHAHSHAPNDHSGHVKPTAPVTIYTCPMHPEIRQVGPGTCPICGMTLEPLMPTETDDDSTLRKVKRHFWISAALSVPVVIIAMLPHLLDLHLTRGAEWLLRAAELLLTLPVVAWAGA